MPVIETTLTEGRTPEQLRRLIDELTVAAIRALDCPIESVRVVLREVPKAHFSVGGVTLEEREPHA